MAVASATGNKGVAEQDVKRVVFASLVGATIEGAHRPSTV